MDRLIEAIEDKQNPSVVGLDPTEALVPKQVVASFAEKRRQPNCPSPSSNSTAPSSTQ